VNEFCQAIVTALPPEKSPKGNAVLLKFQTWNGNVIRLRVSDSIARILGTQLLLLSANPVKSVR
jgi:hypothetical protein